MPRRTRSKKTLAADLIAAVHIQHAEAALHGPEVGILIKRGVVRVDDVSLRVGPGGGPAAVGQLAEGLRVEGGARVQKRLLKDVYPAASGHVVQDAYGVEEAVEVQLLPHIFHREGGGIHRAVGEVRVKVPGPDHPVPGGGAPGMLPRLDVLESQHFGGLRRAGNDVVVKDVHGHAPAVRGGGLVGFPCGELGDLDGSFRVREGGQGSETEHQPQAQDKGQQLFHNENLLIEFFAYSSSLRTARKASVGSWTLPRERIFFLPSFCFSSSFFLRVMSPP